MARFIYKEAPDVDYYVEWSSVVDAPTMTGTRAQMLAYTQQSSDPYLREDAPHHPERRLERCDETGTTSMWIATSSAESPEFAAKGYPEDGSWADDSYIYHQEGSLTRANLFELCHRLDADPSADVSDLLKPFEDDPDVVTIQLEDR